MNKKTLTIAALVVVAVIVGAYFLGRASVSQPEIIASGATPTGTQLIEDYVPIVKYNGGLYTALPIQTTSDLTAVAGNFSGALALTSTFTLGSGGTALSEHIVATSTLIGSGPNTYQITASTTKEIDFTCTGVTSNHYVFGQFVPTTTPASPATIFGGFSIIDTRASTTADVCTARIWNGTGANNTIPQAYASSTGFEAWE